MMIELLSQESHYFMLELTFQLMREATEPSSTPLLLVELKAF
jgi:hypothetical protein